jgi:hypothetical protein
MSEQVKTPVALEFKPNMAEVDRRWKAFFAGDLIDRPILLAWAKKPGAPRLPHITYHDRVFGDIDKVIDSALEEARWTYFGGEALPQFTGSLGTDEVAVYCSRSGFQWNDQSGDTNWSEPFVDDWDKALPFAIQEDNPMWQRMLKLYSRAAERLAGKMVLRQLDFHSNMDLLMSARGSERLCEDLIEMPEVIDRAMASARTIFPKMWDAMRVAGRLDELGYYHDIFSMEGAACLQCDFSCMISGEMFRKWVIPALEEEAAIVKHTMYHWDGPQALRHIEDICATKGLHTLAYAVGAGHGQHVDYIDLHKKIHRLGKSSYAYGTAEEIKTMHRQLEPNKMIYVCYGASMAEAMELEDWLVKNT